MLECIELARRNHLPVYVGNSQFEVDIHLAAAFDTVDRIEYSALGWDNMVVSPVRIASGMAFAPDVPGHGLVLKDEIITASAGAVP